MGVLAQNVERLATVIDEQLELLSLAIAAVDDVSHVGGEHERRAVALDAAEHLRVAEKLAEVDVEEVAAVRHHDVVVVPVADAEHVGGHAVACTRSREVTNGLKTTQHHSETH